MRRDPIRIVPYDPAWPGLFDQARAPVEGVLGPILIMPVEHMGSTAVPGLAAKPIIDMLAVVRNIDVVDRAAVAAVGWVLAPEPGDEEERRLSFCQPSIEERTHHLHVVEEHFDPWPDWILFRDYLRRHPATALMYAQVKRELAAAHGRDPNDRSSYRVGKSTFVTAVVRVAHAEGGEANAAARPSWPRLGLGGRSQDMMKAMGSADRITGERSDTAPLGGVRRFSGRVAIVTGSTADPSIGRSCALRLAREGASVVINGRDKDRVASTEAALRSEGLDVVGVVGSMDKESAVRMLTDRAVDAFGRIDLIVGTLGGAPYPLSFDAISESQLLETVRLNTWPAIALIRAALERGLGDNAGSVVAISSGSPRKTTSAMIAYASAKAALNAMTRTIAADLAGKGVRVNAVSPGLVRTTGTRSMWEGDGGLAAGANLPLGRLTEAEDIAAAVCFLLSDEARQITGITLDVDGGNHLSSGWTPIR